MRGDQTESLNIIEFLSMVETFFQYFSLNWKFTIEADFKK